MGESQLQNALAAIGRDEHLRTKMVGLLKLAEATLNHHMNVRDTVTGPIADALFNDAGIVRKKLNNELTFEFLYSSKIAREFVLSEPDMPDHVWEPQTTRLLVYLSQKTQHVIVGGAYFGDHALLIAQELAKRGGVCHAFEPNTENFNMLVQNARLNHLDGHIKPYRQGLWDTENVHLRLVGDDAYASSEMIDDGEPADDVIKTVTLDGYAKSNNILGDVGLIMLDVEGGEYRALQGAQELLSQPSQQAPNIVFEVHRHYVDWSDGLENTDIIRYLGSFGYTTYAIRDFHSNYAMGNKPIELIPPEVTYLEGPPHGFNMLAVKDTTILENDLFKFCEHVSPKLLIHKDSTLHHPTDGL